MALHRYFKISSKLPGSQRSFIQTVPPNKIVKQASDKGRILKAQQKYSVPPLQSNASSNSSMGIGISLWI